MLVVFLLTPQILFVPVFRQYRSALSMERSKLALCRLSN
jgi:hypothetical protein